MNKRVSRRDVLKYLGLGGAGAVLSACAPQVIRETVEVQMPVEQTVEVEKVVTATPEPEGPRSIQVSTWAYAPAEEELNKKLIARFEELNAPDTIELMVIPASSYFQKIEIMIAGGIAPDVIFCDPDIGYLYYTKGWYNSLQPYYDADPNLTDPEQYSVQAYDLTTFGGEQYGVPTGTDCNLVFYNKDLFDAEGLPYPASDWNWDEYIDYAAKLTKRDDDGRFTQFGTILQYFTSYWTWNTLVWGEGGDCFDRVEMPTKCTLGSDPGYFAWQWIQDLVYKHEVAPPKAEQSALGADFASGSVGLYIDGAWAINSYRKIEAFRWDLADIPLGSAGRNSSLYTGNYWMAAQSQEKDLAWEYLKFLITDEGQMIFAADGQKTPLLKKAAQSDTFVNLEGAPENHLVRVSAVAEYSRPYVYYHPKFKEILDKIWYPELDLVVLNKKSGKDAIDTIVPKTDELLASEAA